MWPARHSKPGAAPKVASPRDRFTSSAQGGTRSARSVVRDRVAACAARINLGYRAQ